MSEHELWNEVGNLYFISGTYHQAAYAYNRSIQLDSGFGRPYCNLALTYVKQGRFADAVQLYQRSIDLLVDDREKAITWYRLGDVYRHLRDYRDAILAYQQADLLDPALSQDRKESEQILYGGSAGTAKLAPPPDPLPAAAQVKEDEPLAFKQESPAPVPAAEPPETSVVAVDQQEPQVAAPEPEPVLEAPAAFAREEVAPDEQMVVESPVASEDTGVQVPLAAEELPLEEIAAPLLNEPIEEVESLPGQLVGEEVALAAEELSLEEISAPLFEEPDVDVPVLQELLVEEAAPLPLEEETVTTEAAALAAAEAPVIALEEPVVEEITTALTEELLPAAASEPADLVDESPAELEEIEPAFVLEPELALPAEETAPESMMMVESPVQEDLTPSAESVADMVAAGWDDGDSPYMDFEHETEVYIPDVQEEALDQWLPITEAESFASESQVGSVTMQDQVPASSEAPHYAEHLRPEYQPAPIVPQRYGTETSPTASLDVDVMVQEEYDQPLFIIPEGPELDAVEDQGEAGQAYPAAREEVDEELKQVEREIERFQQVVQLNPRNASAWDTLGTLYKSARRYRDAIMAYQQAVVVDPLKAPYHHHLGIIYAVEGRDEDAIQAFQEVLEIDPNHSLAHASLGGYYRRMGLEELAQKHIGRAMKNFYNSENEYNRACMEALNGHTEQSIELLRVALKNKQTYVDWVLRDPDLDSIRRDPRFKQLISDYTG